MDNSRDMCFDTRAKSGPYGESGQFRIIHELGKLITPRCRQQWYLGMLSFLHLRKAPKVERSCTL